MPCVTELIELLNKISGTTDKVHIEANRDGREWTWKMTRGNITADEYIPHHPKDGDKRDG